MREIKVSYESSVGILPTPALDTIADEWQRLKVSFDSFDVEHFQLDQRATEIRVPLLELIHK